VKARKVSVDTSEPHTSFRLKPNVFKKVVLLKARHDPSVIVCGVKSGRQGGATLWTKRVSIEELD
jgi:hypothetical protein